GRLILSRCDQGLEIVSIDRGPGLTDIEKCLTDGYSTAGSQGTGLGAIRRLSSAWDIFSQASSGTVQVARVGPDPPPDGQIRSSGVSIPAPGETECGDAWAEARVGARHRLIVADGLGHGPIAALAAREAVLAFDDTQNRALTDSLLAMHQRLKATRGAAV